MYFYFYLATVQFRLFKKVLYFYFSDFASTIFWVLFFDKMSVLSEAILSSHIPKRENFSGFDVRPQG